MDAAIDNPKRSDGLDISPAEGGYIIHQPEQDRVHFLNATAIVILELCNGDNSSQQIADLLRQAYELPNDQLGMVAETLGQLKAAGLVV
jgi:putative component of toxin-antitoxin plasmid stabilization module